MKTFCLTWILYTWRFFENSTCSNSCSYCCASVMAFCRFSSSRSICEWVTRTVSIWMCCSVCVLHFVALWCFAASLPVDQSVNELPAHINIDVLQCVAVCACCSLLQCGFLPLLYQSINLCMSYAHSVNTDVLQCVVVCCSVLQRVAWSQTLLSAAALLVYQSVIYANESI